MEGIAGERDMSGFAQAREYLEAAWHCLDGEDAVSHKARTSIDGLIEEIAVREFSRRRHPSNVVELKTRRTEALGKGCR